MRQSGRFEDIVDPPDMIPTPCEAAKMRMGEKLERLNARIDHRGGDSKQMESDFKWNKRIRVSMSVPGRAKRNARRKLRFCGKRQRYVEGRGWEKM